MTTVNLSAADLNDHSNDAVEIITKVYDFNTLTYRVKDIILTDIGGSITFTRPPTITIGAPNLGNGIQATATSKVIKSYVTVGNTVNTVYNLEIYVTNPGSGYTSPPSVSVGSLSTPNAVTITFDASNSTIVNVNTDIILTTANHGFANGVSVEYYNGGGTNKSIGGLTTDVIYYVIAESANTIRLASSYDDAISNVSINLLSLGTGTDHTISNNLTRISASPVLEIDPLVLNKIQQTVETINAQIVEESIHLNTAKLEEIRLKLEDIRLKNEEIRTKLEDIRLKLEDGRLKLEDLREDLQTVLQEIRDEFDVNVANNIAAIIQNIDVSSNDLISKNNYDVQSTTGEFILGEKVTTPTASGQVMHYDNLSKRLSVGYVSGTFTNGQTVTGVSSGATARIVIVVPPTPDATNDQIARGMMMLNLKTTDTLEDLRAEIRNPTRIL